MKRIQVSAVSRSLCAGLLLVGASAFAHPVMEHTAEDGHGVEPVAMQGAGGVSDGGHRHGMSSSSLPVHRVSITVEGGFRYIKANGIPDHVHGRFPNRGNPNAISEQSYTFRVPLKPEVVEIEKAHADGESRDADRAGGGRTPPVMFGVALNGVPFDPGTAEVWSLSGRTRGGGPPSADQWRYEAMTGNINLGLDDSNAHVQPNGAYHYHALPVGVFMQQAGLSPDESPEEMIMVGYAADGFPIYGLYGHQDANDPDSPLVKLQSSYAIKAGNRPTGSTSPGGKYDGTFTQDWEYIADAGHLDQHNGRFGVTPEYPEGTYYYVITDMHPYIPRTFAGTPDRSFSKRQGGQGRNRGQDRERGAERRQPRERDRDRDRDRRP